MTVLEAFVSLLVGVLANGLWFAAEHIAERIRARKNPPRDDSRQ